MADTKKELTPEQQARKQAASDLIYELYERHYADEIKMMQEAKTNDNRKGA